MSGRLSGKTAIITGASSGIGRAIALAYATEGCANIVCADLRQEALNQVPESTTRTTVQEVEALGCRATFAPCNTTDAAQVSGVIAMTVEKFGRLDVMVNNAGIKEDEKPIWEYEEASFDKQMSVNLKGVFLGTKYAARAMREQKPLVEGGDRGWIVNLASVLGLRGTKRCAGYTSAKHGVIGLTRTAALDCGADRIHVNAICPGYTETNMTKYLFDQPDIRERLQSRHAFRGLGKPEDIARAAVFFGSEDAQWVSGVGLPVDGGYTAM